MARSSLHALAVSHVGFEDLGTLEKPLLDRGFQIESIEAATIKFPLNAGDTCDLLVILGGPIGVYEQTAYPFLKDEIACIAQRLRLGKPTLGICLGAQLMAAALGAEVFPGKNGREIGWAPIANAAGSELPPWFAPLVEPGLHILHWHGDTFDLPAGATHLASTERYDNQAFTYDRTALALQFHPEVTASGLESWYVGHADELHQARIAVPTLREASETYAPILEKSAQRFWNQWLDYIL